MSDPVQMPAMTGPQEQSWHALMDVYERCPSNWALVGGQLVHLHCAERGSSPSRPTNDADTVLDVRANPAMLNHFTVTLTELGFKPDTSGDGVQHRWRRDQAQIDVLIPEGLGENAERKVGIGGGRTIAAPGTTQALNRAEPIKVQVGDRVGTVLRPNIIGALVGKAAARSEIVSDPASSRHCIDFTILASITSARDFREEAFAPKDRARLRKMLAYCAADPHVTSIPGSADHLDRIRRGAKLDT